MKKVIYLSIMLLFVTTCLFSQTINKLDETTTINKGQITLKNGETVDFRNLNSESGIVSYTDPFDPSGKVIEQKISDVMMITKTGNYAGTFAFSCALGGGLGAVLSNPTPGYIIGCAAGGAVIGALIGLAVKKEVKVYENTASLSFYPSFNSTIEGNIYPTLALKINF